MSSRDLLLKNSPISLRPGLFPGGHFLNKISYNLGRLWLSLKLSLKEFVVPIFHYFPRGKPSRGIFWTFLNHLGFRGSLFDSIPGQKKEGNVLSLGPKFFFYRGPLGSPFFGGTVFNRSPLILKFSPLSQGKMGPLSSKLKYFPTRLYSRAFPGDFF